MVSGIDTGLNRYVRAVLAKELRKPPIQPVAEVAKPSDSQGRLPSYNERQQQRHLKPQYGSLVEVLKVIGPTKPIEEYKEMLRKAKEAPYHIIDLFA